MQQYRNEPWYPEWERSEARRKRESGNPADILARMGRSQAEPAVRHALVIPASAENELRRIVGEGIEPKRALAMLAEAGYNYERTGKRTAGLKRRAGVVSTGLGRGSRWRLA